MNTVFTRGKVLMKIRSALMLTGLLTAVIGVPFVRHARAQGALEQRFNELDENGDGKVTSQEWPQAALFARFDLDGNGEITKPEAAKALRLGAMDEVPESEIREAAPVAQAEETTVVEAPVRQGPRIVKPGDHGVGRQIPDVSLTDIDGKSHRLSDFANER